MLIPGEKGDSETDSADLIIYGPAQVRDWKENWNLWATNSYKTKSVYTAGIREKKIMWGNSTDMKY